MGEDNYIYLRKRRFGKTTTTANVGAGLSLLDKRWYW